MSRKTNYGDLVLRTHNYKRYNTAESRVWSRTGMSNKSIDFLL